MEYAVFRDATSFNGDISRWSTVSDTSIAHSKEDMFQGSGFKRTLCGKNWKFIIGNNTDTARYGCCPKGSYMSSPEVPFNIIESCQSCPKGYHGSTIENDETNCQVCPAGTFSVEGASKCCGCDQGTYVKTIDSDDLDEKSDSCPSCNICPLGRFSDERNQDKCKSCPKGYYTNDETLHKSRCQGCPVGKYGNKEEQKEEKDCEFCNEGRVSQVVGLAKNTTEEEVCKSCPSGYEKKAGNHITCSSCEIGSYGALIDDLSKCVKCPAGRYKEEKKM